MDFFTHVQVVGSIFSSRVSPLGVDVGVLGLVSFFWVIFSIVFVNQFYGLYYMLFFYSFFLFCGVCMLGLHVLMQLDFVHFFF